MSHHRHCDWCGISVPEGDEVLDDWLHVDWAGIRSHDYCTAACAVAGIERIRDQDAEAVLRAVEDDPS